MPGSKQDRQVAAGQDMGPRLVQALHQVFEMGIEFRRAAGEVHGGDGPAGHHPDDRVDGVPFHLFRAVGSGQEVAVLAGLVAAPPQVDLQGADVLGLQVGITQMLQLAGKGQHGSSVLTG